MSANLGVLLMRKNVDAAAHTAATSDLNLLRKPTEAQAQAGNYKKGHVRISGLDVTIENPAGSYRRPEWPIMQAHYGYVKGTLGADGDHVDVMVRPGTPTDWAGDVYVVDQLDQDTGDFDEHKCMLGYDDERSATRAYAAHYSPGWQVGDVTTLSMDEFKDWLFSGDTTQQVAEKVTLRVLLVKEFTQSTSATSGITAYGNTGKRKRHTARRAALLNVIERRVP